MHVSSAGVRSRERARKPGFRASIRTIFEPRISSAVGLAPVADAENAKGLLALVEANAVVAHAKAKLGRVEALKLFHVTRAGFGETLDCLLHSAGDSFIERRHVLQGRPGPLDLLHSRPSVR